MKRAVLGFSVLTLVAATGLFEANARPQYASKESKPCAFCHTNPNGGGARNFRGQFYGSNSLSLTSFEEAREAALARVEPNATGEDSAPKIAYVGSVATPANGIITQRSNRAAVVVVFLNDTADDAAKAAVKLLGKVADALGTGATVIGVVKGNADAALKLTSDLGNTIRVLPDADGVAIAKYKAEQGLDFVVIPRFDANDPLPNKSYTGFSKTNLTNALEQLSTQGVKFEMPDISTAPTKQTRGGKLSG